ncbi:PspA/IM30 family protein [Paenibacillus sp. DMB5]|uniref:PspA/IM30 family protein n=1 Tax=Paenibacillus sp. DMB5 TaxID=1780103 RepID=UPI00076BEE7C|nr:PspA/IM30 family protein [Paenibacillus sp. DMB5]KUP25183.1 hypothetical protein AWJ19_29825 [Paenibacillus sp. DMB5]
MSSIFERITTLTKAAIHEGLNKLEDPVLLTGQYLRDLDDKISSAESKQRELKVTASVLERRKAEYLVQADSSEAAAVQAMSEGNEPAARAAVTAKLRYLEVFRRPKPFWTKPCRPWPLWRLICRMPKQSMPV